MCDLIILGTDTDAGKTSFALLWLAAFGDRYAYWKPLESGESDSERIRKVLPMVQIVPPLASFAKSVAPLLAARRLGQTIPSVEAIATARPRPKERHLLIETFGGPLSPLNETELQVELVRRLGLPCGLVTSSAVGAIGRTLNCLRALQDWKTTARVVVMIGWGGM